MCRKFGGGFAPKRLVFEVEKASTAGTAANANLESPIPKLSPRAKMMDEVIQFRKAFAEFLDPKKPLNEGEIKVLRGMIADKIYDRHIAQIDKIVEENKDIPGDALKDIRKFANGCEKAMEIAYKQFDVLIAKAEGRTTKFVADRFARKNPIENNYQQKIVSWEKLAKSRINFPPDLKEEGVEKNRTGISYFSKLNLKRSEILEAIDNCDALLLKLNGNESAEVELKDAKRQLDEALKAINVKLAEMEPKGLKVSSDYLRNILHDELIMAQDMQIELIHLDQAIRKAHKGGDEKVVQNLEAKKKLLQAKNNNQNDFCGTLQKLHGDETFIPKDQKTLDAARIKATKEMIKTINIYRFHPKNLAIPAGMRKDTKEYDAWYMRKLLDWKHIWHGRAAAENVWPPEKI